MDLIPSEMAKGDTTLAPVVVSPSKSAYICQDVESVISELISPHSESASSQLIPSRSKSATDDTETVSAQSVPRPSKTPKNVESARAIHVSKLSKLTSN